MNIHGYPLVNVYIAMENHHAINGKIHYFDWAIFNSFLYVHQRVLHVTMVWMFHSLKEKTIQDFPLAIQLVQHSPFTMKNETKRGILW